MSDKEEFLNKKKRRVHKVRQERLTSRLQSLRQRVILLEKELKEYTERHFRVCIFGSARIKPNDSVYETTRKIARLLGEANIDVLTGGGPGLMEAANLGLKEGQEVGKSKSKSFGITIELNPFENDANPHIDIKHHHKRFSSRLDDFMRFSNAIIVVRGGIGTVLELFFSWQLLQVKHISDRPVILVDRKFWNGLFDWVKTHLIKGGLVSESDMKWIQMVDTPEEVLEIVKKEYIAFLETEKEKLEAKKTVAPS